MNDRTRVLLLDALDAIESTREPADFDPNSRYRSIVRTAASDYRACYLSAREANGKAHAAITAALEADPEAK